MKLKSFTLLEMIITLTIFAVTMIVIYNLIAVSMRFMESIRGSTEEGSSFVILTKLMDNTLKRSYKLEWTNDGYLARRFDEKDYFFFVDGNTFVLGQLMEDGFFRNQSFELESAESIDLELKDNGAIHGLSMTIEFSDEQYQRLFLLGYMKETNDK